MSLAQAEALFSTPRLDVIFLSPTLASAADKVVLSSPKFIKFEYGISPEPGFVAELLESPPPPGISRVAVFPMGIVEKGQDAFVGIAHLILGYPTETAITLGLMLIAESRQRKGYGQEFLTGVYDWARPQGITFIRGSAHPKNEAARAFLEKAGFTDLPEKLSTGHQIWERHIPAVEED
jgi:GNAT superfamily N-acetyltransferase